VTYTFSSYRELLLRFAEHAALRNVTLVAQDWGGTLGLTLPVDPEFRSHLDRLLVPNTVLPIGEPLGPHYYEWRSLVRSTPDPPVGQWMRDAAPQLTEPEMGAYDALPRLPPQGRAPNISEPAMVEPQMRAHRRW
jgi:haloalkane dehalogenase